MAVRIAPEQIENRQNLEAGVSGPDGADRMYVVTGILPFSLGAFSNSAQTVQQRETFTALVGPTLERRQFIQAVATASIGRKTAFVQTPPMQLFWQINSIDADWDDESRQTELRVEVTVGVSGTSNQAFVNAVPFQVTILAAVGG
jgi:hypothetical protein